jgi:hypothetical protein
VSLGDVGVASGIGEFWVQVGRNTSGSQLLVHDISTTTYRAQLKVVPIKACELGE